MKWFIGTLVVVNLLAALYGALKQKPEVDIHAQEVNAAQLKMLPANWKPPVASAPEASAPVTDIASSMPQAEAVTAVPSVPSVSTVSSAAVTVAAPKEAKLATVAAKPEIKAPEAKAADKVAKPADSKVAEAKPAAATLCYSWGGLDPQQLARVQGGVPLLKLSSPPQASVVDQRRGSGKAWVFYPPLATQAETQTLVAELKAKGFDSYIVQTAGEFKGYLSLGLFGREEGAQALVKRLKAAGYDKTKVDSRGEVVKVTTLSFRQLDDATAGKLKALQQRLLPGIPLQACR
jgi:hypothetical protein